MTNIENNVTETGIMETLCVLNNHKQDYEIIANASLYLPIPEDDIHAKLDEIVDNLCRLKKEKFLFLTPEIAIIEKLCDKKDVKEILVCLPSGYNEETYERIFNNKPTGIKVTFINENEVPLNFTGNNAAIVGFGFCDNERAIILNYNYRMMERYKSFYGYRILVSCGKDMSNTRPIGWTPINIYTFFNEKI
ncbi:MAG: hypothetical protein IJN03_00025 [Bacilli bacterium]|nr:hypothetical protein [Bacilli bacterium]